MCVGSVTVSNAEDLIVYVIDNQWLTNQLRKAKFNN